MEDDMEAWKLIVSIASALIAIISFVIARRADARSKKAESIKNLLGEKESVAFAALKLLRDGLPEKEKDRKLVLSGLMQACVFERSSRARALLYRVIELNRVKYRSEFRDALTEIKETFDSMNSYGFTEDELELSTGVTHLSAAEKAVDKS
jgi:hypothetical protein